MRGGPNQTRRIKAYGVDPWVANSKTDSSPCVAKDLNRLAKFRPAASRSAWPIGLEIAVQEGSFAGSPTNAGCSQLIKDFGVVYRPLETVRPLSNRPPSELAANYLFRNCDVLSVAALCKANALLGGGGVIRVHPHQTSKYASQHRSVFMPAPKVPAETEYLVHQINSRSELEPFKFAVAALLHTLIIHPFSDANGRLACLLFQYCLFKRGIIGYPLVPLGPFLEKRRSEWLHALLTFHIKHRSSRIQDVLARGLNETIEAVKQILESELVSQEVEWP